jgi:hypothetical protein
VNDYQCLWKTLYHAVGQLVLWYHPLQVAVHSVTHSLIHSFIHLHSMDPYMARKPVDIETVNKQQDKCQ